MEVTTAEEAMLAIQTIDRASVVCADVETTGLRPYNGDRNAGVAVKLPDGPVWYFPFRHRDYAGNLPLPLFKPLAEAIGNSGLNIYFNAKFDMAFLRQEGMPTNKRIEDPMLAAHMMNENEPNFRLKGLGARYIDPTAAAQEEELARHLKDAKLGKGQMWQLPGSIVAPYACQDVNLTLALRDFYRAPLQRWKLDKLYEEQCEYALSLYDMESNGMHVDPDHIEKLKVHAEAEKLRLLDELRSTSGIAALNPGSSVQVNRYLGVKSSAEEALKALLAGKSLSAKERQFAQALMDYRGWIKALGSYYNPYLEAMDSQHLIHANLNMIRTVSTRLSCSDPNLQAVPASHEEEDGATDVAMVKQVFVGRPGHYIMQADYSQAELRVLAHYINDQSMITALESGIDFHGQTATEFNMSRDIAKRINFGIAYGLGAKGLSERTGISLMQARRTLNRYHDGRPGIRKLSAMMEDTAMTRGYIRLWTGRMRHFGPQQDPHKAMSNLIQGAVAEIVRVAINRLHGALPPGTLKTMQVHDSVMLEIPNDVDPLHVAGILNECMLDFPFLCKLRVDIKYGPRWSELKELKIA